MNNLQTLSRITPREKEILGLVARDYSTPEIAGILGISIRTVETHRKNIIKKVNNKSLSALTRYAIVLGLLDDFVYLPSRKNRHTGPIPNRYPNEPKN